MLAPLVVLVLVLVSLVLVLVSLVLAKAREEPLALPRVLPVLR